MASVSIRDLKVAFGYLTVIEKLALDIEEGEFIVLLGPSGCGKSTLLNAIAGLLDIAEGQIWIGGRNVTWEEPKDRGIGMVFQSYALYPRMTVEGNLSFGLRMAGVPKVEIERRVRAAARLLQIEPLMKRRPAELSGGQRQRVAIGRALVRDAKVFLFDEPLSNLDAKLRSELRVEIKRLHQELGSTMIYVTHDQVEAMTLADRIAVMKGGVIQQLADPHEIYHRPENRFVADFIGSPAINFVEGRIEIDEGRPVFRSEAIEVPLEHYAFRRPPEAGRPATLGLRPEHIGVGGGRSGVPAAPISAEVSIAEPMGAETVVWCRAGPHSIALRTDGEHAPARGEIIRGAVDLRRLNLFDPDSGVRL